MGLLQSGQPPALERRSTSPSTLRERLEAARARQQRASGADQPSPACNLLVVSDLHLGENIKEHSRIEFLKRAAEIDHDFCDFLDYYGSQTVDDKPWRLVINGDFLDFLTVTVTPSEQACEESVDLALDPEEEIYGLDTEEENVVWKLERIVERHQVLFAYLADFVGRGHYLDLLYGNHDSEFYWPSAKESLVRHLTNIFFGTEKVPGKSEETFSRRVRWHEWFFYEAGKFYIEHGNQYDDFSSFRFRLAPVLPYKPTSLAMPASHQVIRFFVNRMRGFQTHNKDNWGLWDFLRWTFRQGRPAVKLIAWSYFDLTRRLVRHARTLQHAETHEVESRHGERLAEEAARYGMERETVERIDALHNGPIHTSVGGLLQAGGIDRWALIAGYSALLVPVLFVSGWPVKLVWLTLWLLLLWGRRRVLKGVRDLFMGGEITTVIPPKLDHAAEEIAGFLDVRYVLFGHTHRPFLRQVREEPPCWYVNHGAWLVPRHGERPSIHRPPLTYCRILDRAVPEATLFAWSWRAHRPEVFLTHHDEPEPESEMGRHRSGERRVVAERGTRSRGAAEAERAGARRTPSLRKRRF